MRECRFREAFFQVASKLKPPPNRLDVHWIPPDTGL